MSEDKQIIWHLNRAINSYNVGQGLAPAEKDGTSKPVPYINGALNETSTDFKRKMIMNYFVSLLLIWNIIVMLVYGIDKMLSKAHKRRISEASLLTCAFLMGGCGAMFGMVLFNHKTSKMKFRILVPMAILLGMLVVYWISRYLHL